MVFRDILLVITCIIAFIALLGSISEEAIPNPTHVFGLATKVHTVATGGVWYNITMNRTHSGSVGFSLSIDNVTIIIPHDGHYTLTYGMGVLDSNLGTPDAHVGMRISLNGVELSGSYVEADTHKKDVDFWVEHTTHALLEENDRIILQYISDDTTVTIEQEDTFATQGFSAFGYLQEIVSSD